ncbi:PPR repeat [Musa troglodytarum]|uniref:mRNA guanylyltransferase n=1 Tax=Musa troglodytarum TaxID=320322 RepID=A0A9E7GXL8_9LILI|nr:PPR repeat [Musa troglodytarum]
MGFPPTTRVLADVVLGREAFESRAEGEWVERTRARSMYKKKASVLTIRSLSVLSKWRWLSTAAQQNDFPPDSLDGREATGEPCSNLGRSFPSGPYQNSNWCHGGELGGVRLQNPEWLKVPNGNGVSGVVEHQRSNLEDACGGKPYGSYRDNQMTGNGSDRSVACGSEWRTNGESFHNPNSPYQGNYSGACDQNSNDFSRHQTVGSSKPCPSWNSQIRNGEFCQNPNSHNGKVHQEDLFQRPNIASDYKPVANAESYQNVNDWSRSGKFYQDSNRQYDGNCQVTFGKNLNVATGHHMMGNGKPYAIEDDRNTKREPHQNFNDQYRGNYQDGFGQNPNVAAVNHTVGGGKLYYRPDGGFQQQPDAHYGYNPGNIHHHPSSYSTENPEGDFSSNQQGIYSGRAADIRQTPNVFYKERPVDIQHDPFGNQREDSPVLHQGPSFSQNAAGYDQSLKCLQFTIGSAPEGSPETGSSSTYKGTIEELDDFCREKKVTDAVEVLALLEKNDVMVDLPRCGSTTDAFQLFDNMPQRNLTTWDTMIMGLANNGLGEDAIDLFTQLKQKGLKPDGGLFVSIFAACGSLGAVDEGLLHFESMKKDFSIVPSMEHYASIVDMLGRTGYLDEALEFIDQMPVEPSVDVWETLMTLSRLNGNLELGDRCAEIVECLDPSRLIEQSRKGLLLVKDSDLAKEKEKKKTLEIRSRVHEYRAGDTSHPENDKIYAQLRCLQRQMKEAGYVPDTRFVLHDVDPESKEEALLAHSERLALSYGLMTTPARTNIRIMKNLREHTDSKILTNDDILGDAIPIDQQDAMRHLCYQLLDLTATGRGSAQFPGSHPVSLNRDNLQLLRQRYYYATWKADGTRYMMFITNTGCYLIDRNFCFRRVQMRFPLKNPAEGFHSGTLIDGEMIIDKIPDAGLKRRYLAYDLVALNHHSVVKLPFSERWKLLEEEVVRPRNNERKQFEFESKGHPVYRYDMEPFSVRRKDFWFLSTVAKLLKEFIPRLSHEADGLIFQGWDDPYIPRTHEGLLKWKYPSMNSVDFLFEIGSENRQLLFLFERGKKKLMDGARVSFAGEEDIASLSGKIVECSWDPQEGCWSCMRIRTDKATPNDINTYRKVMRSINDNITEEVLLNEISEIVHLPMYADRIARAQQLQHRQR